MARFPGHLPPQPRPLYNMNDPSLLSTFMRKNLERGAVAQKSLQTTLASLPPRATAAPLQPKQLDILKRQLTALTGQPVRLSADEIRRLQATLRAAWMAIQVQGAQDQRTRNDLARWHAYLAHALGDANPTRSR
jgi:hypothetical protein